MFLYFFSIAFAGCTFNGFWDVTAFNHNLSLQLTANDWVWGKYERWNRHVLSKHMAVIRAVIGRHCSPDLSLLFWMPAITHTNTIIFPTHIWENHFYCLYWLRSFNTTPQCRHGTFFIEPNIQSNASSKLLKHYHSGLLLGK